MLHDGCGPYLYRLPPMVPLSKWQAVGICWLFSVGYVASLYIWKTVRDSYGGRASRDDPRVIVNRFKSVAVVCAVIPAFLLILLEDPRDLPQALGLSGPPGGWLVGWRPVLLTLTLFLGPASAYLLSLFCPCAECRKYGPHIKHEIQALPTLQNARTLVVAPFSEEFVFRACSLPVLLCAGFSPCSTLAIAPLFFGTAHLHHGMELLRAGCRPLQVAVSVTFQLAYTSLFGAFACFVLLRTSQLSTLIIVHAVCNSFGFPDFPSLFDHHHKYVTVPALFMGIVGFYTMFRPWTLP